MDAKTPKCESCFDAVCREPKLLAAGDWTLGDDARYHWSASTAAACGARTLAPRPRPAALLFIAAAVALAASACAPSAWVKAGATQQEFYADRSECMGRAGFGAASDDFGRALALSVSNDCMRGKGWR